MASQSEQQQRSTPPTTTPSPSASLSPSSSSSFVTHEKAGSDVELKSRQSRHLVTTERKSLKTHIATYDSDKQTKTNSKNNDDVDDQNDVNFASENADGVDGVDGGDGVDIGAQRRGRCDSDECDDWMFSVFTAISVAPPKGLLIPPLHFAMVDKGVYRSGYPQDKNFAYLKQLRLKSILYLATEPYNDVSMKFIANNNITLFHHGVEGNQEPFVCISEEEYQKALVRVLDNRNHPILIHCHKGNLQKRTLTSIFDEYRQFTAPGPRCMDLQFIELFNHHAIVYDRMYKPSWIPE